MLSVRSCALAVVMSLTLPEWLSSMVTGALSSSNLAEVQLVEMRFLLDHFARACCCLFLMSRFVSLPLA